MANLYFGILIKERKIKDNKGNYLYKPLCLYTKLCCRIVDEVLAILSVLLLVIEGVDAR